MSIPAASCCTTTRCTAASTCRWNSVVSTLSPRSERMSKSRSAGGRGKLPTCVVRIRFSLLCITLLVPGFAFSSWTKRSIHCSDQRYEIQYHARFTQHPARAENLIATRLKAEGIVPRKEPVMKTKILGIVMAGGEGTRLQPLTRDRAKPAVPFGGKYRIIDFVLSNFINSELYAIHVLVQFKSQSLIDHLPAGCRFGGFPTQEALIPAALA